VYVGGSYWGITACDSYEEALAQAVRDIGTTGENVQVAAICWVE
jgi:hypothetical protein